MAQTGVAESFIENDIGCGPFQVIIVIFVFLFIKLSSLFTFIFMSYGNYNPGWRCLDNVSYSLTNATGFNSSSSLIQPKTEYEKDLSCEAFEACNLVEFNPESLTIATEWNLVCNRAWISSLIISVQMAGNLLASFVSGQLADSIGRKKTTYGSLLINAILTGVSVFSPSWQIFAVFRFFIGMASAFFESLNYVYPAEFMTRKWRGPLMGIPGWTMAGAVFGLTSMLLKNWKHLLIFTTGLCIVSFIPVLWIPESLRWLEVKNRKEEFRIVARKMARLNKKPTKQPEEVELPMQQPSSDTFKTDMKKYTLLDLYRPGYRLMSVIVGFVWASISFIFYGIGFGIKALSGDFYLNLIMVYLIAIPFAVFPLFAPNLLGRRKSSCIFIFIAAVSLISATFFELYTDGNLRLITTLVLVMIAEVGTDTTWCIQYVLTSELYPTVVRGLAVNWGCLMARIGGIIAPFMIPKDSDSVYIWYLVMGCLGFVCCCLLTRLPETRGKPLMETFDDKVEMTISGMDTFEENDSDGEAQTKPI